MFEGASRGLSISGGRAAAGARTRAALGELLGIAVRGAPWQVESALWTDDGVKLSVRTGDKRTILFEIARRGENARGVIVTDHLVVSYTGENAPRAMVELMVSTGAKRLAPHTLDTLAGVFSSDPEFGHAGLPVPDVAQGANRSDSLLDTWGASTAFADFFAVDELARGQLDSLDPTNLFVFVQHGDIECQHLSPHGPAPVLSLVSYPWDNRLRTERAPLPVTEGGTMLTSELDENDVILGNPEKLHELLRRGAEEAERRGLTLFVSNTCVPMVTGEDVESPFRACAAGCTKPALYLTIGPQSMVNVFGELLVKRRQRAERSIPTEAPDLVNLFGFPNTPDQSEIRSLLEAAGVRVNAILIPALSQELIDELPRAALNVFRPNATWEHLYAQIAEGSRIPNIRPLGPFGVEGTRRWLAAVAEATGHGAAAGPAFEERFTPLADRWRLLRAQASSQRIGLIVRAREIHNVLEPASTWGVPLIALLEEMGFGLDVLLMLERPQQVSAAKNVHAAFADPTRHTIKAFDTMERMGRQLEAMQAQAVFSHHAFDWRVTRAGKNLFSLQHIEMGIEGAVRTAERLVGICGTPFYRRFAPYLARTDEGERKPLERGESGR